jgi:RNA polymerase sigma-70 factor (ECF subfamily)
LRPSSDDDLMARAKRGDEAAWAELYAANAGKLGYWLRHRPCADVAAHPEDLAAEAWLRAAERIADFRGSASDFTGWLFQIARMTSANAHRRTTRRATTPVAVDDSELWGATVDGSALVDGADWIRRLIATLPAREAEVVLCLDVIGLDGATTSAALGISSAAVRVSHHRGLRRLRQTLSSMGGVEPLPKQALEATRKTGLAPEPPPPVNP